MGATCAARLLFFFLKKFGHLLKCMTHLAALSRTIDHRVLITRRTDADKRIIAKLNFSFLRFNITQLHFYVFLAIASKIKNVQYIIPKYYIPVCIWEFPMILKI